MALYKFIIIIIIIIIIIFIFIIIIIIIIITFVQKNTPQKDAPLKLLEKMAHSTIRKK